jgi:hypothetical protein
VTRRKQSSWWAYVTHKTKHVVPDPEPLDIAAKLAAIKVPVEQQATVTVEEAIGMETVRTFSLRVRKYWNL